MNLLPPNRRHPLISCRSTVLPTVSSFCRRSFNVSMLCTKSRSSTNQDGPSCIPLRKFFMPWLRKMIHIVRGGQGSIKILRCFRSLKLDIVCDNYVRDFSDLFHSSMETVVTEGNAASYILLVHMYIKYVQLMLSCFASVCR